MLRSEREERGDIITPFRGFFMGSGHFISPRITMAV
jgi:hypothetical protein